MDLNKVREDKIVRLSIWSFAIKILGAVLSFMVSILIAKNFEAEGVGLYSLANSILNVFVIISAFGFENSIIKFVSIYFEEKEFAAIRKLEKYGFVISGFLSILSCICIFFLSGFISLNIFKKNELQPMLNIIILAVFPICSIRILSALLKGIDNIKEGLLIETVLPGLFNVIFLFTYFMLQKNRDNLFAVISFLTANIFSAGTSFLLWKKCKRKIDVCTEGRIQFEQNNFIKTSFNLLLVSATNYILSTTDTLMLGVWNTESEIGIYSIATKITTVSSMLLIAVNAVVGPYCAKLHAKKQIGEIKKLIIHCMLVMAGFASVFFVVCVTFRSVILGYFGAEFLGGELVLTIAAFGQLVVLATGPVATTLMMIGYEKMHRNNTVFCAFANIFLNFILIPRMGITGAALATTISLIIKNIIAVFFLKTAFSSFR